MKRYADDYKIVVETDKKGKERKKAVYNGNYFSVSLDEQGLKNLKRNSLILYLLIVVLHFFSGFVSSGGMYQFYVAFPYVFAFLPLYFLITGILRLPKEKRTYRRDETGLSFRRIKKNSLVLFILLAIAVLGEGVYWIFFSSPADTQEHLFLITEAVAVVLAYFLVRLQLPVQISEMAEK